MVFAAIRTERLLLRPVRLADAHALAARRSDPEVAELQSWTAPYPLERAQQLVADAAASDAPRDGDWWMLTIADAADATILGDLAIHPTWDGRSVEIGYTLAQTAWGHGYAREAVEALIARLFTDDRVGRIHAMTHPDNVASAQVLERNGFLYEGRTRLSYWVGDDNTDDVLYGLTRADWHDWQQRPQAAPADVRLVEITSETVKEVRALVAHKSQERFVSPVAKWFGDALFPPVFHGGRATPRLSAIDADGTLVGIAMLNTTPAVHDEPYLWRLLIDRRHQRRGIGTRALDLIAAEAVAMGGRVLKVTWAEGRGSPGPLYRAHGFVPTGTGDDGGTEAELPLT